MNVVASPRSNLPARVGAGLTMPTASARAVTPTVRSSPVVEPTRVTLGIDQDSSAVYGDPRTSSSAFHVWASPVGKDDSVSALMARNRMTSSSSLSDNWRGLGGALLTRFGQTGEDYGQTRVDKPVFDLDDAQVALPPEEQAQRAADILAREAAALQEVTTHAATAGLTIRTRSGQSVALKISVSTGSPGVKVELKSSGAMSAADRAAVAQLADGLDRALEGLGRDDAVGIDLSGLMNYERNAIASVDLATYTGETHPGTYSLHLGDDKQSIALKGSDGELRLSVDGTTSAGAVPSERRSAAIQRTLDRMQSAAERGQVNAALVEQMASAFTQLQTAAAPAVESEADASLSGLSDFDASFGGETLRLNRFGAVNQAGHADYHLGQQTTTQETGRGGHSVAQTVSEQLSADFKKAPGDAMLNVDNGNYAATRIRDRSTATTLIESSADGVKSVLRETDEQRLKTVSHFENHKMTDSQSWPSRRHLKERLQQGLANQRVKS